MQSTAIRMHIEDWKDQFANYRSFGLIVINCELSRRMARIIIPISHYRIYTYVNIICHKLQIEAIYRIDYSEENCLSKYKVILCLTKLVSRDRLVIVVNNKRNIDIESCILSYHQNLIVL